MKYDNIVYNGQFFMEGVMKKAISILLSSVLVSSLLGCSSQAPVSSKASAASVEEEPAYVDTDFLNDLAKGLMARWDISEHSDEFQPGTSEYKEHVEECVHAELDILEKYKSALFKDGELQVLAISYINALNAQLEALYYYGTQIFDSDWDTAYDTRVKVLSKLLTDYEVPIEEKYQPHAKELIATGNTVSQKEDNTQKVKDLVNNFHFEETSSDYDYHTYEAVVENTTGIDFESFSVNINLYDEDGVLIDSYYDYFDNWKSGVKAKFSFETDKDFATTEVSIESAYDYNGNDYK